MLINKYYDSSEQEEKKNEYYIQELQKYIHEKNISSKDADQLNRWVEQQKRSEEHTSELQSLR